MGDKTGISWTDWTWNPTRGCIACDPGCANCYAQEQAARVNRQFAALGRPQPYEGLVTTSKGGRAQWTGATKFVLDKLDQPLRRRKPSRVFVDSMSDLFYDHFTFEQIAAVFGVMAAAPQHTFQVLTKRAQRMHDFFRWLENDRAIPCLPPPAEICGISAVNHGVERIDSAGLPQVWPLPNVWLGVSVSNQEGADTRIPWLLQTPAAIRFLSCEPLLEKVDLEHVQFNREVELDVLAGTHGVIRPHRGRGARIDWVIAGCESGARARPCEVDWLRSLRDQCVKAGAAFFLKQAVSPWPEMHSDPTYWVHPQVHERHDLVEGPYSKRKKGGVVELPYLDGVQHAAFPAVA